MPESAQLISLLKASIRPLPSKPVAGLHPVLPKLKGIRAVVFDFYDTLILTERRAIPKGLDTSAILGDDLLRQALRADGRLPARAADLEEVLSGLIAAEHARIRWENPDVVRPEIDFCQIMRLAAQSPALPGKWAGHAATRWEAWTTSSTLAPKVNDCLEALRGKGVALGIGSNAQAASEHLFAAHFGGPPGRVGFHPTLVLWSWRIGRAKPDPRFFELLAVSASSLGIARREILFVGNDPSRDILPAGSAGFATALYAGDARAIRPRPATTKPDAVLTCMSQLPQILETMPGLPTIPS